MTTVTPTYIFKDQNDDLPFYLF